MYHACSLYATVCDLQYITWHTDGSLFGMSLFLSSGHRIEAACMCAYNTEVQVEIIMPAYINMYSYIQRMCNTIGF